MFKVLFRVIRICIPIKDSLDLLLTIKKNKETIYNKNLYPLIDGIANVNYTSEFYISKQDPKFELFISLNYQKVKKLVGYICINLNDWQKNNSYQQIRNLEKSPGGKALIQFGFIYEYSQIMIQGKQLFSEEEIQSKKINKYRSKIELQNIKLKQKVQNLNIEKQQLNMQYEIFNEFQCKIDQLNQQYNKEILLQQLKMAESTYTLKQQQTKRQFLLNLVKNSGQSKLIQQIQQLYRMEPQQES